LTLKEKCIHLRIRKNHQKLGRSCGSNSRVDDNEENRDKLVLGDWIFHYNNSSYVISIFAS
jgi:hypothetical protein